MINLKKILFFFVLMFSMSVSTHTVFASEGLDGSQTEPLSKEEEALILQELSLEKERLSEEEKLATLTKGTAVVWNKTYKNEYGVKKALSMSDTVHTTGNKPYTTIKITNTGSTAITVVAYKGAIHGSTTLHSMIVLPGKTKTMTISRKDVINYGTINGQGTRITLAYTVSAYNINGNRISFSAYAKRYD